MTNPSRPGRKPFGQRPMTAAEKKREQRAREKAAGFKPVTLSIHGERLETIEQIADIAGITKAKAIEFLLHVGLKELNAHSDEERTTLKLMANPKTAPKDEIRTYKTARDNLELGYRSMMEALGVKP